MENDKGELVDLYVNLNIIIFSHSMNYLECYG